MRRKSFIKRWRTVFSGLILFIASVAYAGPRYCDLAIKDIWLDNQCRIRVEFKNVGQDLPASMIKDYVRFDLKTCDQNGNCMRGYYGLAYWRSTANCLSKHGRVCSNLYTVREGFKALLPGNYKITAKLKYENPNVLWDYNSRNNELTKTLTCTRILPDFVVSGLKIKRNRDNTCNIQVVLKNKGGQAPITHNPPAFGLILVEVRGEGQSKSLLISRNCDHWTRLGNPGGEITCEVPAPMNKMREGEHRRVTVEIIRTAISFVDEADYSNNKRSFVAVCPFGLGETLKRTPKIKVPYKPAPGSIQNLPKVPVFKKKIGK